MGGKINLKSVFFVSLGLALLFATAVPARPLQDGQVSEARSERNSIPIRRFFGISSPTTKRDDAQHHAREPTPSDTPKEHSSSHAGSASNSNSDGGDDADSQTTHDSDIKCVKPKDSSGGSSESDETTAAKVKLEYSVTLKTGVDFDKHMDKVNEIIESTAKCDKEVKAAVKTTPFLKMINIYMIVIGPTGAAELKKLSDIKNFAQNVRVDLD